MLRRSSQLGRTPYFFNSSKGEDMDTVTNTEAQETNLQERAAQALADDSLPAAQVIEEQSPDAEQNNTPRFIP